jgi:hypothetical protein
MNADRRREQESGLQVIALVETGEAALEIQIVDELHYGASRPAETGCIVDGFGARIKHHPGNSPVEPPGEAHLPGIEARISL